MESSVLVAARRAAVCAAPRSPEPKKTCSGRQSKDKDRDGSSGDEPACSSHGLQGEEQPQVGLRHEALSRRSQIACTTSTLEPTLDPASRRTDPPGYWPARAVRPTGTRKIEQSEHEMCPELEKAARVCR
jgi:hypothetical protein